MATSAASLAERRQVVADAAAALRDLRGVLFQCPNGDLAGLAGDLAELRALCAAGLVAAVAEAETRGLVAESQCATTAAWIADAARHSRPETSTIAKAARVLRRADLEPVTGAILDLDIDPATAVVVGHEYDKLAPDLRDDARPLILDLFLSTGAVQGPAGVRHLKQEILARYGVDGEFDKHQDRCRRQIDLDAGTETSPGVWDFRLTTDDEGRAVIESAIGPLSAPHPDSETGERDARPVGLRRGQALIEALRRSVSAAHHVPTSPKAVLMLTMSYDHLAAGVGAATTVGSRAAGTLLGPETVRRLACDASIIPVVLGADGEVLDQGRAERLFTPAQVRAMWLRDRHCTFPRCDAPAQWSEAHHLIHWIDGGPTDLDRGALLCPRHHTIVHRDRLAGLVTPQGVSWDLRPGSYRPPPRPAAGTPPAPPGGTEPRRARRASNILRN